MNRVIIVVRGGTVQSVFSDQSPEVSIIDYDEQERDYSALEKEIKENNYVDLL